MPGRIVTAAALLAASLTWCGINGCVQSSRPEPRTEIVVPSLMLAEECDPLPGPGKPGGTIIFALTDSVNPGHAPVPHNVSERIVFRNLYETLVEVDCAGRLSPALAASWESFENYRTWVFTLRADTRAWDGAVLTAADVKRSWITAQSCPAAVDGHSPLIWLNARAASVKVLDDRRLAITLPEAQADFPLMLAHAALAVAVPRSGRAWPVGTGPCRLDPDARQSGSDLVCKPHRHHPRKPTWERLVFRVLPGEDPRDVLGGQADLVLARDRAALNYFSRTPRVEVTALPWDRLYLLLCPPGGTVQERQRWYTGWNRRELARDVVGAVSQPADESFFFQPTEQLCPQLTGPVEALNWPSLDTEGRTTTLDRDVIVYPEGDEDARRLAERIAALAGRVRRPGLDRPGRGAMTPPQPPAGGEVPQAIALSRLAFGGGLQSQRAGAYVLTVERSYPSACLQIASLLGMAEWIQQAAHAETVTSSVYPPGARLAAPSVDFSLPEVIQATRRLRVTGVAVPLVITRAALVASGRLAGVRLAYDGTPLLAQAGWVSGDGSVP